MTEAIKSARFHEHVHTARMVTSAFVAIAMGLSYQSNDIAALGLQTVLELVYQRQQAADAQPELPEAIPA